MLDSKVGFKLVESKEGRRRGRREGSLQEGSEEGKKKKNQLINSFAGFEGLGQYSARSLVFQGGLPR